MLCLSGFELYSRWVPLNFGRKTFTGNRTDTNWSSLTFKGKISVFIVVFKFVIYALCYLRTIRLTQENFNTNYTRRHKFITHKNHCCQVFSRSRNDQPMFVNEYKFKEGWQSSSLKTCFLDFAEQNVNIFLANPNHTPRFPTNMSRRIAEDFNFR